jgi:DNA-binding transcriptional LysR family regulator
MTGETSMVRLLSRLKMRHMMLLKFLGSKPNIRRAAADMNISQPAASALLREIEDALNVELFERDAQGIKATAYGRSMIQWANLIVADLELAKNDIQSIADGAGATVRLGMAPLAAPDLLPKAIEIFRKDVPKAMISAHEAISSDIVKGMLTGLFDVGISLIVHESQHSSIQCEPLFSHPVDIVVRRGHPLTQTIGGSIKEIGKYQWALPASAGAPFEVVARRLTEEGCPMPEVALESASSMVLVNMIQASDLVSVLPRALVTRHASVLAVIPPDLPNAIYPVSLLSRSIVPSLVVERFLAAVRKAAQTFYV